MMPTRALFTVVILLFFINGVASHRVRILHDDPLFPSQSLPPPPPPSSPSPPPPPPAVISYPFFPSIPSPPPPPTPYTASLPSFPANISSLIHHPHFHSKSSHSLIISLALSLSLSAAALASVAAFLYFRHHHHPEETDSLNHHHDNDKVFPRLGDLGKNLDPQQQQLEERKRRRKSWSGKWGSPDEEEEEEEEEAVLYLGTMVGNGRGIIAAAEEEEEEETRRTMESPELQPLPPLSRRQSYVSGEIPVVGGAVDDEEELFYSPRDSPAIIIDVGLGPEKLIDNHNMSSTSSRSSSSSSSLTNSPDRSSPDTIVSMQSPMIISNPLSSSSSSSSLPGIIEDRGSSLTVPPPPPPPPPPLFRPRPLLVPPMRKKAVQLKPVNGVRPKLMPPLPWDKILASCDLGMFWDQPRSASVSSVSSAAVVRAISPDDDSSKTKSPDLIAIQAPISRPSSSSLLSVPPKPPPPPPPPPLPRPSPPVMRRPLGLRTPLVRAKREESDELKASRPKLKPLHWDKVIKASSDRDMVWDHLRSSSFKLNEEMIETLFIVNDRGSSLEDTGRKTVLPPPKQENRVLDPKKAQNIAILLRAVNVTREEVCDALMEGNADTLGAELLQSLSKMAPTKEEERKLKEYQDDSPVKLGHAERFLKSVIDVPFAFKRVEAMLYVSNFDSEVEYLKKSFETLEVACDELRNSRMFLKLLEAVLKTGNRMNVGTNRGDAHAFKLDTLLKLVDVKGADGKTTLLHFVVQEIIKSEGARLNTNKTTSSSPNDDAKCRKLGLQVVSSLSSELTNVKKAASMDSDVLSNDVSKLSVGLANIEEAIRISDSTSSQHSSSMFSESMSRFMKIAEEEIIKVQAQESVALSLVKEITEYFHGNSAKEEAHPFRIFLVVRDFLAVLDSVCKEVGMINERTVVSSAHKFPVPVNPMLPVPVNPMTTPRGFDNFCGRRQSSSSDGDSSPP